MPGQGMLHQLARGTLKNTLQDVPGELPLGFFGWFAGLVHMRPLVLVPSHSALLRHDLQEFQNCRVTDRFLCAQRFVHFANGRWSPRPKDSKNLQLGGGWFMPLI